jgi:hypothetical protein
VWADQHVLPGAEIIFKAGETSPLSGNSIACHRAAGRPALAMSSVEQDLDLLHVFEFVHQGVP